MSDAEILAGASVTVTLCGLSFEFREPVRRTARAMLAGIADIEPRFSSPDPAVKIACVNDVLDWLYQWSDAMRAKRAVLDNADEQEIAAAFKTVSDMVLRPFVPRTAPPAPADTGPAPTTSPPCTTESCASTEFPSTT